MMFDYSWSDPVRFGLTPFVLTPFVYYPDDMNTRARLYRAEFYDSKRSSYGLRSLRVHRLSGLRTLYF